MRVRLDRISESDLNLFEFDYDITMMVFFLNAKQQIYARFGGRDARDPDNRMSLAGLRHTMQAVLAMHKDQAKLQLPAPPSKGPKYISQFMGGFMGKGSKGCVHCHQVKEIMHSHLKKTGQWTGEEVWRFPPPDNLGLVLDVDRGDTIKTIAADSAAARTGLAKGDLVRMLNGIPVHSFGDAQYALDRAPKQGAIDITWQRDGQMLSGKLQLADGWRRTDISWRPSLKHFVPSFKIFGDDLTPQEKANLSLPAKYLAYRPSQPLNTQAKAAGLLPGDVIVGVDGKKLELDSYKLYHYIRKHYVVGERITFDVLRDGKALKLPMTLTK